MLQPSTAGSGPDSESDGRLLGEHTHITERIVVSPCWGRLRPSAIPAGQPIAPGAVIGSITEAGDEHPLVCHARALFVAWLARDGERVSPGKRVATLRLLETGST